MGRHRHGRARLRDLDPAVVCLRPAGRTVPVRLPARLDPIGGGEVLFRRGRHLGAPDPAHHPARFHLGIQLVHRDHASGEGVLRLPAPPADGDARRLHVARLHPLLRLLGGHAGADVLPHRHLGRAPEALRGDQVLPLHPVRFGAHAGRHPGAVLLQLYRARGDRPQGPGQRTDVRYHDAVHDRPARSCRPAVLDLPRVLRRLRDQGADVPVPHLASRRARRGTDRGLGDPGRRPAEDGDVRLHPLVAPAPARRHEEGGAVGGRPGHRRDRLRRARRDGAEGHEEAGRVLVGVPPRLRHARACSR